MNLRNTDKYISLAVAAVLLLAVGFIAISAFSLKKRQLDLSLITSERIQQMLRLRLDGMFHEIQEDLREEAAVVEDRPEIELWALEERWRPLMTSHWSILAIRLADEHGNELAYFRDDDRRMIMITSESSKDHPPMLLDPETRDTLLIGAVHPDEHYDPRQRIWFGKALENTRADPTWNIRYYSDTAPPILQVSLLIRSPQRNTPFRIMEMDIDLSRSTWIDTRSSALSQYGIMLLDGTGRTIRIPDQHRQGLIPRAEAEASAQWAQHRTSRPFSVYAGDRHFRVLVMPYALNGLTLYSGVLLDIESIAPWTRPEKIALMIMAVFLVVLAALLGWMALRKRKEDQLLMRQARRSRTQEKKLAKALGEREVLNREVHHRVKNNLQVVSSLLNLQATRLDDGPVKDEFIRGKKRIDLIALVHHKLYGSKDLRNVDVERFFKSLITGLAAMHHPQSRTVSFEVDTDGLVADQDTAIELGIILCELISNCFQHAFPYATGGHVDIQVRSVENDLYRMIVKDNGQGLPTGYSDGPGKLGLEIVEALAEQLDGEFHMRESGGVTFEVLFRMSRQPYADPLEA